MDSLGRCDFGIDLHIGNNLAADGRWVRVTMRQIEAWHNDADVRFRVVTVRGIHAVGGALE
jgi:hypothetical protein